MVLIYQRARVEAKGNDKHQHLTTNGGLARCSDAWQGSAVGRAQREERNQRCEDQYQDKGAGKYLKRRHI